MNSRRRFSPRIYKAIIDCQKGICACGCKEELGADPRAFQFDHIRELWDEGEDTPENLQALLIGHHRRKTSGNTRQRAKMNRIAARDGLRKPKLNARDKVLAKMLAGSDSATPGKTDD